MLESPSFQTTIARVREKFDIPAGAAFAYEVATKSLGEQLRTIDSLDTKASVVMAADGILAGLLFRADSLLARAPRSLALPAVVVLFASMGCALGGLMTRRYETAPESSAVARRVAASPESLRWRFLTTVTTAIGSNAPRLDRKARLLTLALVFLLGVILLIGAYSCYWILVRRT